MFKPATTWCVLALAIWALMQGNCLCYGSQFVGGSLPPAPSAVSITSTNTYHLTFTWDNVTNAQWYGVIVRTNGVEAFRRWSMTNSITISNIGPNLDDYRFTAIATNTIGASDESNAAALHWLYVVESDSLSGPWTMLKTNSFEPSSLSHFVNLTRWDAASVLKPD